MNGLGARLRFLAERLNDTVDPFPRNSRDFSHQRFSDIKFECHVAEPANPMMHEPGNRSKLKLSNRRASEALP
jgi:hypothetical protein